MSDNIEVLTAKLEAAVARAEVITLKLEAAALKMVGVSPEDASGAR